MAATTRASVRSLPASKWDKNCRVRLLNLQKLHAVIRVRESLGMDVFADKLMFDQMAVAYNRDCPYWIPVERFFGP